jgi:hypothetical protein
LGWRDILSSEEFGKDRKERKEHAASATVHSDFSDVSLNDTREEAQARDLYYRYSERNGFTEAERDADIGAILENPASWITYFLELENTLRVGHMQDTRKSPGKPPSDGVAATSINAEANDRSK